MVFLLVFLLVPLLLLVLPLGLHWSACLYPTFFLFLYSVGICLGQSYCPEVHSISDLQLSRPTFCSGAFYFVTQLGPCLDSTVADCLLGILHLPDSDCHLLHLPIYLLLSLP